MTYVTDVLNAAAIMAKLPLRVQPGDLVDKALINSFVKEVGRAGIMLRIDTENKLASITVKIW